MTWIGYIKLRIRARKKHTLRATDLEGIRTKAFYRSMGGLTNSLWLMV